MEHEIKVYNWKTLQFLYGDGILKVLKKLFTVKQEYTDSEVNKAINVYVDELYKR